MACSLLVRPWKFNWMSNAPTEGAGVGAGVGVGDGAGAITAGAAGSTIGSSAPVPPTAHSQERAQAESEPQDSTPLTIHVDSQFKDPGELTDIQRARCGMAQPGVCEAQLGGHSTLTGTMSGWTDYTTWGHGNTDGSISYYSHETFTGSVAGCGFRVRRIDSNSDRSGSI